MKKPPSKDSVRLRMADLCSRSEQCSYDIGGKLHKSGLSSEDCTEILNFLKREKFIDDSRFAKAYANDKARFAGWGCHKIKLYLMAKHIKERDIAVALESINKKEYIEAFKRAAIAKARSLNLLEAADAQRFYRHLASRGYETELISKMLQALRERLKNMGK